MQVTKDRIYGLDVYRVDGAPVAGRASDEYDDHWYVHVKGDSIYAFVPTADGSDYEEIVIDESHDAAERWSRILNHPQSLAEAVKKEVDARLIDRMMEAGELKLHFHGSDGDGYLSGHEAAIGSEADIRSEAAWLAKEFVEAGSGDEDWTGWKIVASTEHDGQGLVIDQFGFEELGVWSPKPEVEFDPSETYTGVDDDMHKAFWNALEKAQEDGLTFDAVEGLSMDVSMDTDAEGMLFTRVDIEFRPNDSMTVMFWEPDDGLREVVNGEDIDQVVDAYDEDWIALSDDAVYALADQWKAKYENGEAEIGDLVNILVRGDANDRDVARHLDLGGDNEDVIRQAYDRFTCNDVRKTLLVTSKGDGIVSILSEAYHPLKWEEIQQDINAELAKTTDEDEVAELKGMLAAVEPSEIHPTAEDIAAMERKAVETSGIGR